VGRRRRTESALSAATACLYGLCHAAILSLGFSPALGFIHTGKQLSFVYDLADLYKMKLAVPVAFEQAKEGMQDLDRRTRQAMRDRFRESRFLETISSDLMKVFGPDDEDIQVYDEDAALPGLRGLRANVDVVFVAAHGRDLPGERRRAEAAELDQTDERCIAVLVQQVGRGGHRRRP
jgi:hypothetical protein